ncbi:MAG: hypothetical protein HYY64_06755 [Candidatus Rokubacteria bacterium]|nr:hypothetical protein [Candidatus Rokubacteria bacterium]
MSTAENWKTIGLEILQVHTEECGDGSCECGCADIPGGAVKIAATTEQAQECCEPACGPETGG